MRIAGEHEVEQGKEDKDPRDQRIAGDPEQEFRRTDLAGHEAMLAEDAQADHAAHHYHDRRE